jgi:NADH-quinone oxidoreductase subunit L
MFLALGVGAWSAAIFHFMTHAFFKALLFLAAGVVSLSLHHEHNMFKMGGLRKQLPVTFWTFLIGAASLAALPLVTAGFYSKELILSETWSSPLGSVWLWAAGLIGALITSLYVFRMVFLTFFGEAKPLVKGASPLPKPGPRLQLPLVVLAVLSVLGGFVEMPATLGGLSLFSDFMHTALPAVAVEHAALSTEWVLQIVAALVSLAGIYLAYLFYFQQPDLVSRLTTGAVGAALQRLWLAGWGFDWLYDQIFVQPYIWLAQSNKEDNLDLIPLGVARLNQLFHHLLSRTQSGQVRWYALSIALGAILTIAIVVLL